MIPENLECDAHHDEFCVKLSLTDVLQYLFSLNRKVCEALGVVSTTFRFLKAFLSTAFRNLLRPLLLQLM